MQGRRASIVVGAGAAILALILIFFLVLPKMGQVTEAEKELEDTTAEQQVLQARLNALEQARDEAPLNEATIRRIDQQVPPTADLSAVILFLRNAASVAGVQVISLTPAPPVASTDRRILDHLGLGERRVFVLRDGEVPARDRDAASRGHRRSDQPHADRGVNALVHGNDHVLHERPERRTRLGARSDRDRRGPGRMNDGAI